MQMDAAFEFGLFDLRDTEEGGTLHTMYVISRAGVARMRHLWISSPAQRGGIDLSVVF